MRPSRVRVAIVIGVVATTALVACEKRAAMEPPICDVNETGINDSTIGPLAIGEPVPALRQRCPAIKDTILLLHHLGWTDSVRALRLVARGAPLLATYDSLRTTAGPAGATVTALRVESPFFRTNDSLGVGSSVARFKSLHGIRVTRTGEDARIVLLDRRRCGVMYELSQWGDTIPVSADDPPRTGMQLGAWSDSIVVKAVTVTGCRGNVRDLGVDSVSEALSDTAAPADSLAVSQLPASPPLPAPSAPSLPRASTPSPAAPATGSDIRARANNGALTATAGELAELAAVLDVPVQGIAPSQLRDTYAEPRGGRVHEALDILAPRGTPVLSATDGTLRKLFSSVAGGLMVYAGDASDRFLLLYGHLDRYAEGLKEGMPLRRGQVIGYVGTTGNAPIGTPHLHFAIMRGRPSQAWWRGSAVNPYPLLTRHR